MDFFLQSSSPPSRVADASMIPGTALSYDRKKQDQCHISLSRKEHHKYLI